MYTMRDSSFIPSDFKLRFEVQPSSLATELADSWNSTISATAIYTLTRASAGESIPLTLVSASASEGILSVTVSAANIDDIFFEGGLSISTRLKISDGDSEILSGYITLIPLFKSIRTSKTQKEDGDYIDKNGTNFGSGVTIDGVTWAPVDCGSTSSNPYGIGYGSFIDAQSVCPDGWRTPTIKELESLTSHSYGTKPSSYLDYFWYCTGSSTYSSSVPAVLFLQDRYWSSTPLGSSSYIGYHTYHASDGFTISTSSTTNSVIKVRCVKK